VAVTRRPGRLRAIPLPDPPLADAATGTVLRPWGRHDLAADAESLATAWQDTEVARATAVPARPSVALAARWIAGEAERREQGLAIDLVVAAAADGGRRVLGEVGLAHLDLQGRAEIGFWLGSEHRRRGAATAAVVLLTAWALAPAEEASGLGRTRLWARTVPGDARAAAVLERAGYEGRGEASGSRVWTIDAASVPP